jgi:hypothetical protein
MEQFDATCLAFSEKPRRIHTDKRRFTPCPLSFLSLLSPAQQDAPIEFDP